MNPLVGWPVRREPNPVRVRAASGGLRGSVGIVTEAPSVRLITFNTAVGNPQIKTDQRDFLNLPFYREIIEGQPDAAVLAAQEVGPEQAKALKGAAAGGQFHLIHIQRPGQGNALVIPARFRVVSARSRYYVGSQLKALAKAMWLAASKRERFNHRQYFELRMWSEVQLHDDGAQKAFTILNTHLSGDPQLRLAQAQALFGRAHRARQRGPVILAGDLNTRAAPAAKPGRSAAADAAIRALFPPLQDMAAAAVDRRRPNIDYLLASGFSPVRSRLYTDDALVLPGLPSADLISDHYAKEAVVRFQ